jgi:hypothetical protein
MEYKIGDVYRTKTGEILEVGEFKNNEFCFRMRHPVTLEMQEQALYGPIENLHELEGYGLEKIDLKTYEPTGLNNPTTQTN